MADATIPFSTASPVTLGVSQGREASTGEGYELGGGVEESSPVN